MKELITYLNESPTVFFILKKSDKWELEYVTDNVEKLYGASSQEFINKTVKHEDFIHEDDINRFIYEKRNISLTDKNEYIYEPYRILKGDEVVWLNHITKIIRDKSGKATHYFGYITDISVQKNINNELTLTQDILDIMFDNSKHGILLLDDKYKIVKNNRQILKQLNLSNKNIIGSSLLKLSCWDKGKKSILLNELNELRSKKYLNTSKVFINSIGNKKYLDFTYTVIKNEGKLSYIICEVYDTTHIEKTKSNLQKYLDIVNDYVLISRTDEKGIIIDVSDAYCKLTGYQSFELVGRKHNLLRHPSNEDSMYKNMWRTIKKKIPWEGEIVNLKKDATEFWVENRITADLNDIGEIIGYTSIYNNITDKKEISELLIVDFLTKIYNRRHFNTVFEQELKRSRRHKKDFVFMILDIDYFKQYNDNYGHDMGDKVLYEVAQALKDGLKRSEDFVFRLGGEEFGIITSSIDINGVEALSNKIVNIINELQIEHKYSQVSNNITVSIGVKHLNYDEDLESDLIYKVADQALYKAKKEGRNRAVISS